MFLSLNVLICQMGLTVPTAVTAAATLSSSGWCDSKMRKPL